MRRKPKHIIGTAAAVSGITALVDVLMQWSEHAERGLPFNWEGFDGRRTLKKAAIGAVAGAGLGYLLYEYKVEQESGYPFCSDDFLNKLLAEENLKSDPVLFEKFMFYKMKVQDWLHKRYAADLVCAPILAGSFFKRTAISSNYDLDILLAFLKNAFATLEEMYDDVYSSVGDEFQGKAVITRGARGIGVTFDNNGIPIHIDVVPGREIGDFKKDHLLNFYVNPSWFFGKGSSFKTNVRLQKNMTVNFPAARRVIKLLKLYRDRNGYYFPSIIIEQCVLWAMANKRYGVSYSDTENLLNAMAFTSQALQLSWLPDITNSNHNLLDKMSAGDRNFLSNQLASDTRRIENKPRYIKEIFP
jgi:hypothetical protein